MKKRSIEETIEKIKKENSSLKPCSTKEIEELELFYTIKLPASYKSFLAIAGKDSGNLMIGSEYSYKHLFKLKEIANEHYFRLRSDTSWP